MKSPCRWNHSSVNSLMIKHITEHDASDYVCPVGNFQILVNLHLVDKFIIISYLDIEWQHTLDVLGMYHCILPYFLKQSPKFMWMIANKLELKDSWIVWFLNTHKHTSILKLIELFSQLSQKPISLKILFLLII
jgi:hypothetical protein